MGNTDGWRVDGSSMKRDDLVVLLSWLRIGSLLQVCLVWIDG